ncbi:hypothetical protein SBBP2_110011 [Burkholderiales bacterium]|nr:hypothetical protein SBBP2_110011 [Burkholderiales bacterium]
MLDLRDEISKPQAGVHERLLAKSQNAPKAVIIYSRTG